ncbi:MAG TPA: hypothetical protein PKA95_07605 [Thermomicrobiales bacterium]|nr:hypothetical protein [Thermomicrobiales bacterium]
MGFSRVADWFIWILGAVWLVFMLWVLLFPQRADPPARQQSTRRAVTRTTHRNVARAGCHAAERQARAHRNLFTELAGRRVPATRRSARISSTRLGYSLRNRHQ